MSLQVWLPLNGDLTNQGLSNVTVTNNGATVDNSGKIGKCYSVGSSKRITSTIDTSKLKANSISFACWVYITSWNSSYDCIMSIADGAGWNQSRATLCRNNTTSTLIWNIANNSASARIYTATSILLNTWTHIAATYDGATLKIYLNGVLDKSAATTLSIAYAGTLNIGSWTNANNYPLTGKINDVRIYDHALSAQEVAKLAQGLILHYPLNNNGMGGENILTGTGNPLNSYSAGKNAATTSNATGDWGAGSGGNGTFSITVDTTCPVGLYSWNVLNNTSGNRDFQQGNQPYITNQIYTVSFYAKGSGTCLWRVWNNTDSKQMLQQTWTLTSSWAYYSHTFTAVAEMETDLCSFQLGVTGNASISICGMKMEKGSIATPWSPAPFDLGLDTSIVYDISGFKNHGTISGNLTATAGGPRYKSCTVFNGSSYIACGKAGKVTDAITVGVWAYMDNWSNYGDKRLLSCTEGGGWTITYSYSGKIRTYIGTGASSNTYKLIDSDTTFASLSAGWHHFCFTYDGLIGKLYIDGSLDTSLTCYTTKTPLYYDTNNGLFIGAEAGSNTTTPAGSYFNGKMSDARIYATALSPDDVAELYALGSA